MTSPLQKMTFLESKKTAPKFNRNAWPKLKKKQDLKGLNIHRKK